MKLLLITSPPIWLVTLCLSSLVMLSSCSRQDDERYLIFLHNAFLETNAITNAHGSYGRVEYNEILDAFSAAGLHVISEHRQGEVEVMEYAGHVVGQIDSLLDAGVSPDHITVVGVSKGGYIAQHVSTLANNPQLNFVFIACHRRSDIQTRPEINFCGRILNIYDVKDILGQSAAMRWQQSSCAIPAFKEVALDLGMGHGFIFKRLDDWIVPTIAWAKMID